MFPLKAPTEADAARLVELALGERAAAVRRFPTGLAHYVYDVQTEGGRAVVARIAHPESPQTIAHALGWSELLRPLGVPLPQVLYADPAASALALPSMLMERLPGTDLWHVYHLLSFAQKRQLAAEIVRIQAIVQALPQGAGYGYAGSYAGPFPQRSWAEVVESSLERSRSRIAAVGVADPAHVERVARHARRLQGYFAAMPPRPFLDDTTTKNVIVHEGRLSGIVDVDVLCFGDPLSTVALTRTSLLNLGYDLDYIRCWCQLLRLTDEQELALEFYTALCLVDFISEVGQRFNQDEAVVDQQRIDHLERLLDQSLKRLEQQDD